MFLRKTVISLLLYDQDYKILMCVCVCGGGGGVCGGGGGLDGMSSPHILLQNLNSSIFHCKMFISLIQICN